MEHAMIPERWLPTRFLFTSTAAAVKWLNFGTMPITEPFFQQTLANLRSGQREPGNRTTTLGELLDLARQLPLVRPSGIIFHISRCGSTLLANLLRAGERVLVLSEARTIGCFFHPFAFAKSAFPREGWEEARRSILNAIITLYAHDTSGRSSKVVIKCNAISILHAGIVRSVWPDVPAVILIRDPVEVIVSNLFLHAGWVRWKERALPAARSLRLPPQAVEQMSLEEYCARMIGHFCGPVAELIDDQYRVLDYSHLDFARVAKIAELFDIPLPPGDSETLKNIARTYSKDPHGMRFFEDDRDRKQRLASDAVKSAVLKWAQGNYDKLRGLGNW